MKNPSTFFRAVKDYRKVTEAHPECLKQRKEIAGCGKDGEKIEIERTVCRVDTDWIEEIEKGLVFVEKALREERQFIRSNGEVVPIEKVKHISKSSVEHLARHSEFITRETGEDIIPDQIYTVERLTDYAVYENKFLYMMLCYLRDFVQLRYSTILEAVTTYKGKAEIRKTVRISKSTISFYLTLDETTLDDEYLLNHNEAKDALDRIDLIYKTILLFLSFPLMQEVAKAPPLRPPVTKTNVLKMNHNFKNSLALYDYIRAYEGDGFTLEKKLSTLSGFKNAVADEFAELLRLSSFLTYEHGLGMQDYLQERYEKEEQKRRQKEQERLVQQLAALKKRVAEEGVGIEEYALMLEKRNKALEEDSIALVAARARIEELETCVAKQEAVIERMTLTIEKLNARILALEAEIDRIHWETKCYCEDLTVAFEKQLAEQCETMRAQLESALAQCAVQLDRQGEYYEQLILEEIFAYEDALAEQLKAHEAELARICAEHRKQLEDCRNRYEARIAELIASYEAQLTDCRNSYEARIAELTTSYETQLSDCRNAYEARIAELTTSYETQLSDCRNTYEARIAGLTTSYETQLSDCRNGYEARIAGLTTSYETQLSDCRSGYEERIDVLTTAYEAQLEESQTEHEERLGAMVLGYEKQLEQSRSTLEQERESAKLVQKDLATRLQLQTTTSKDYLDTITQLKQERLVLEARNKALREILHSFDGSEDFIREDNFNRIEEEYAAFKAFFKKTWKQAKRDIRQKAKRGFAHKPPIDDKVSAHEQASAPSPDDLAPEEPKNDSVDPNE